MVLSQDLIDVIEKNYSKMVVMIPPREILFDLRGLHILSDDEVDELKDDCRNDKERAYRLIKTLKSREDEDFYQFCRLLQEQQVRAVQLLGQSLYHQALSVSNYTNGKFLIYTYSQVIICFDYHSEIVYLYNSSLSRPNIAYQVRSCNLFVQSIAFSTDHIAFNNCCCLQ